MRRAPPVTSPGLDIRLRATTAGARNPAQWTRRVVSASATIGLGPSLMKCSRFHPLDGILADERRRGDRTGAPTGITRDLRRCATIAGRRGRVSPSSPATGGAGSTRLREGAGVADDDECCDTNATESAPGSRAVAASTSIPTAALRHRLPVSPVGARRGWEVDDPCWPLMVATSGALLVEGE